ncbi:class I SAM-dependent methyltransferase [Ruminococcus albus]|uniref:Methyltransferase type 11 n=1 Tax=Ruminococcus albus (strain ATCC 27210 / DSM 20455 / JCM 14654 / NCDO 2250 / 7) TaxID=697329 RepID=E6UCJ0_RUMA7|nr:methyltransferase domain-containing protein [Ruminococcus albus]ADU21595.1 Methyltransferase type 11 [Ruminococcus albus 7 = DSM 20455]
MKKSFWDCIAGVYDLFERLYNKRCYDGTGAKVASYIKEDSRVLECACGTGSISRYLAEKAGFLRAVDLSSGMLRQAEKNLRNFHNVRLCKGDIYDLRCRDNCFDYVVAGNVIHLLDEPYKAVDELLRVCKKGGKVIIPTYINLQKKGNSLPVKLIDKAGANFKRQFDEDSYKQFFTEGGYKNVVYDLVDGRMPCAIAVITKE